MTGKKKNSATFLAVPLRILFKEEKRYKRRKRKNNYKLVEHIIILKNTKIT